MDSRCCLWRCCVHGGGHVADRRSRCHHDGGVLTGLKRHFTCLRKICIFAFFFPACVALFGAAALMTGIRYQLSHG